MSPLRSKLTTNFALWLLLLVTLVITGLFLLIGNYWGFSWVDGISDPAAARDLLSNLTATQTTVHAWTTATVDVAYPLAYGLLFAGVAWRFYPQHGNWLALPGLLAIPVDLAEGVVQVLATLGTADWLAAKAWLTPLKSALFLSGMAISFWAWLRWLARKVLTAR